jgi:hypothetical protein
VETTRGLATTDDETPLKYAFIAAATSKESAYEHIADGKEHGALTYFLTRQLRAAKAGATYRDVMDAVVGSVTAYFPAQHPQLEGTEADQYVFGDSGSLARSYVAASPLDGRRIKLSVGQVEGATVGSVYEIYAPGSKKFALPEKPVAQVKLSKVNDFDSEASIVSGGKVAPFSRAVEREHRYGASRMRVYLEGVDNSAVLKQIRDALPRFKQIEITSSPAACNVHLRQVSGSIQMLATDLTTLSPPISIKDDGVVDRYLERLVQWAKFFNVLSIGNARSSIDVDFTLKRSATRGILPRIGKADLSFQAGEGVDVELKNNSDRDIYVAVLDLSSDGSISVVYPSKKGEQPVLTPGSTWKTTLTTNLPQGRARVTDILKVFASFKPIDLTPLTQQRVRDIGVWKGDSDPLQDLLVDSTGMTRQVSAEAQAQPQSLGTWATTQRVLVVKK